MKITAKGETPYLFEDNSLPQGFHFPESYLNLLKNELPDIEPWWWLAPYRESSVFWLKTLQEQFPYRTAIPFAKADASDDVVCFDGTDMSGNPKVLIIHTFCSSGWEDRGTIDSFDEWLKITMEESKQFKLEKEED